MAFDVYSYRPAPPEHWMEPMKQWGRRVQESGQLMVSVPNGVALCEPLSDRGALDAWVPVQFLNVQQDDGSWAFEPRRSIAGQLGVLIIWLDGSLYDGVAPRQLSDLVHLYRVARLNLEADFNAGLIDTPAMGAPLLAGAALH